MLIFYSLPFSNYSAKVTIALKIKGIDHEKAPAARRLFVARIYAHHPIGYGARDR